MPIDDDPSTRDSGLEGAVAEDFRILNTQAPRRKKSLAALLREPHPSVPCHDGNDHHFRKGELERLAAILGEEEREELLLPLLIEISGEARELKVRTKTGVEAKVLESLLRMPVDRRKGEIFLSRKQLPVIRRLLKTSTQYIFLV